MAGSQVNTPAAYGIVTTRVLYRDPAGQTVTEDRIGTAQAALDLAEAHAKAVAERLRAGLRHETEPDGRRVWWCRVHGQRELLATVEQVRE